MAGICIIGGGASGIAAAIAARMMNPDIPVCILEKSGKIGRKLLATGNGRCNFTNMACENSREILDFFKTIGISAREEEHGRVYPYSGRAKDILDAFELYLNLHNVKVITGFNVESLNFNSDGMFIAVCGELEVSAAKVLLATGGKAGPQFGCSGDGYRMAKAAGHTVTKIIPVLSPVECAGDFSGIDGIRVKASVSIIKKGEVLHTENGEVQFAGYGLSGVCVFNLSRYIKLAGDAFTDFEISVDLIPELGQGDLEAELEARSENPNISPGGLLISLVPGNLSVYVLDRAYDGKIKSIARVLKDLRFTVTNVKGWKSAQCTSGGVPLCEINQDTMESRLTPGLYFAGELIDYDGPCGGYNLNNAWETGIKAGRAMAKDVQDS